MTPGAVVVQVDVETADRLLGNELIVDPMMGDFTGPTQHVLSVTGPVTADRLIIQVEQPVIVEPVAQHDGSVKDEAIVVRLERAGELRVVQCRPSYQVDPSWDGLDRSLPFTVRLAEPHRYPTPMTWWDCPECEGAGEFGTTPCDYCHSRGGDGRIPLVPLPLNTPTKEPA